MISSFVRVRTSDGPVLVLRPDGTSLGRLSIDMLTTFARARLEKAAVCVLRPSPHVDHALLELTTGDVPVVRPGGIRKKWFEGRWNAAAVSTRAAARLSGASAVVWHELSREFRHHSGDERLPADLRSRLRVRAQRYLTRSEAPRPTPLPRRLLREGLMTTLPPALLAQATQLARSVGIAPGAAVVALEAGSRPESLVDAITFLREEGYTVVRIGQPPGEVLEDSHVIDLTRSDRRLPLLEVYVLHIARFVVCESTELQQIAYLTNTPSLAINSVSPFASYPVRSDGLFLLKRAIDLDSGRELSPIDRVGEWYFRNLRNCGYSDNSAGEVLEAVREMHEGAVRGWFDAGSQARFRQRVVEAGLALAPRVSHVAEWGPDGGFIGSGRLVRFQAEAAA